MSDKQEIELIKLNPKITVNRKAIKFLFEALDIKKPHCTYCGKRITLANWRGLFRAQKEEKNIIICKNICCLMYYMDAENPKFKEEKKP